MKTFIIVALSKIFELFGHISLMWSAVSFMPQKDVEARKKASNLYKSKFSQRLDDAFNNHMQ